ncbi:geranylgeranylglycerol-phosphate geranylgeranyltransferase [Polaribacter uvawellassae]|uniref:geranylgeranylglycerol-phosphate geranylgeranyltransferase n=1 Tax=Polaribacter uvawellassae TaxID=3133495 RepID=UPI00321B1E0A
MRTSKSTSFFYKLLSLLSVVRGYNVLVLILAQYLAAIFIFSPKKSLRFVLLDYELLLIVLASVCVVSSGYIINNFYDVKADIINKPIKTSLDNVVSQKIKLKIYFLLNFLGFIFGFFISWRAALFFAVYIFAIWLYSHKLKKHPFIGLISAAVLTILPFFAIFVYYKNFSKIIFVHATFLFLVLLLRQLIKDLGSLRGDIANNYITFPVKYGERNTRKLGIVFIVFTFLPTAILLNYSGVGYMKYYFLFSLIILIFIGYFLWKANLKKHYILLHTILKIMLLLGILSLLFIDPSLVLERVIDKLN